MLSPESTPIEHELHLPMKDRISPDLVAANSSSHTHKPSPPCLSISSSASTHSISITCTHELPVCSLLYSLHTELLHSVVLLSTFQTSLYPALIPIHFTSLPFLLPPSQFRSLSPLFSLLCSIFSTFPLFSPPFSSLSLLSISYCLDFHFSTASLHSLLLAHPHMFFSPTCFKVLLSCPSHKRFPSPSTLSDLLCSSPPRPSSPAFRSSLSLNLFSHTFEAQFWPSPLCSLSPFPFSLLPLSYFYFLSLLLSHFHPFLFLSPLSFSPLSILSLSFLSLSFSPLSILSFSASLSRLSLLLAPFSTIPSLHLSAYPLPLASLLSALLSTSHTDPILSLYLPDTFFFYLPLSSLPLSPLPFTSLSSLPPSPSPLPPFSLSEQPFSSEGKESVRRSNPITTSNNEAPFRESLYPPC
ncbi:hypothetical protein C7M84_017599 [Penaeus vannamei]|uniref:Uncharacterized protein n=1 Tax=Penaeus vannamei TaxID=6689 RepID=A0A423SJV0_PENVA|nr:hypothetical protein C7M84_017599 [Penaeus vannamei]